MLIRVLYENGRFDYVKPHLLEELIYFNKIAKFFRSNNWAVLGIDPIRGKGGVYIGPERRNLD